MTVRGPVYCPNCGATLTRAEAAGRERPICRECGFVYYQNPVPAVGLLIETDGGLVLIRRGHPPHADRWALPSGFIEADESVEDAAVREGKEETGLDVALTEMVGVFSFPDGPPTSGIIVFYRARPLGGELRGGDDAAEARVYAPDDLPELPFRTHREAIERWRAHRRAATDRANVVERRDFYIREATPADADRVLDLAALIPGRVSPDPEIQRAVRQRFRENTSLMVFVAETYGAEPQVIGFVALSRVATLTGALGWLDAMAVDLNFRRRGVGAALLEAVLRRADRLDMTDMFVNTERASDLARAFYRSSGFQEGQITRLRLR